MSVPIIKGGHDSTFSPFFTGRWREGLMDRENWKIESKIVRSRHFGVFAFSNLYEPIAPNPGVMSVKDPALARKWVQMLPFSPPSPLATHFRIDLHTFCSISTQRLVACSPSDTKALAGCWFFHWWVWSFSVLEFATAKVFTPNQRACQAFWVRFYL